MTEPHNGKRVEKIELTNIEKSKTPNDLQTLYKLTNGFIDRKLCGVEFTLDNGWKISIKNKRFAKELGVPM